jgi:hypothetical protein
VKNEVKNSISIFVAMLRPLFALVCHWQGVGKEVRGLKKHADPRVAAKALAVVAMWKATVELENK